MTGLLVSQVDRNYQFPSAYVDAVFYIWYKNGRPGKEELHNLIPPDEQGRKPHTNTLYAWMSQDSWVFRADELDTELAKRMEEKLITERMEMLNKHADYGVNMTHLGWEYLVTHKDEINPNSAVRLVVEGIRIERDSRGLANLVEEVNSMSDDKLLAKLKKTLENKDFDPDKIDLDEEI